MPAIGGAIERASIGGRSFRVAQDADVGLQLGGKNMELELNGDGSSRYVASRVGWMTESLNVSIDNSKGDLQYLQDIVNKGEEVPMSVILADGSEYYGTGMILGELKMQTGNSTAPLKLGGGGELKKKK